MVIYIYLHINTKSDTFFYITIIAALVCGTDDDDDGFNAVHWEVGRATRKTPSSPVPAALVHHDHHHHDHHHHDHHHHDHHDHDHHDQVSAAPQLNSLTGAAPLLDQADLWSSQLVSYQVGEYFWILYVVYLC